ncbi:GtrA family protein [Thalassotalea montiporae]
MFIRFCSVGAAGFLIDVAAFFCFYSLLDFTFVERSFLESRFVNAALTENNYLILTKILDIELLARVLAFWVAATFVWWGNRQFTFCEPTSIARNAPKFAQWLKAFASAHLAGCVNIASFYWLNQLTWLPIAFAGGVLAGLMVNYAGAKYYVFAPIDR